MSEFQFKGDENYWRGSTANQTIEYRKSISNLIQKNGFTIEIQKNILHWGGIFNFNQFDNVNKCIQLLDEHNIISETTAKAISSYSKLFAFYKPDIYFILDARVCYVYNNLVIKNRLKNLTPVAFNISRSRNETLKIKYKDIMKTFSENKLSIEHFYPKYCVLVKMIHQYFLSQDKLIFKNKGFSNDNPEIIEMFLFFLADYI